MWINKGEELLQKVQYALVSILQYQSLVYVHLLSYSKALLKSQKQARRLEYLEVASEATLE